MTEHATHDHASLRLVCSAPWRDQLQCSKGPRPAGKLRRWGNVIYLPTPIAAYRLRHTVRGTDVEIVSRGGHVTHIDRSATPTVARQILGMIWADHSRPVLPEISDLILPVGGAA